MSTPVTAVTTTAAAERTPERRALEYNLAVSRWQPVLRGAVKAILFGSVRYHGNPGLLRDEVYFMSNFGAGTQDWHADLRAVHCGKREVLRGRTSTIIERDPALGGKTSVVYNGATLELIDNPDRFDANPPSLRLIAQNLQTETGNKGAGKGNNGAKAIVFAANKLDRTKLGTLARVVDSHLDLLNHCMPLPPDAAATLDAFGAALCRVACIPQRDYVGALTTCGATTPLFSLPSGDDVRSALLVRHAWYAFTRALFEILGDPTGNDLVSGSRRLQLIDSKRAVVPFSTAAERAAALEVTPRTFDAMIVLRSLKNLFGADFVVDQGGSERERHGFAVSRAAANQLVLSLGFVLSAVNDLVAPQVSLDSRRVLSAVSEVEELLSAAAETGAPHAGAAAKRSVPPQHTKPKPKPKTHTQPAVCPSTAPTPI